MKAPLYKGSFLFGAMQEVQNSPLEFYQKVHRELGDIVHIRTIPGFDFYSMASPEAMSHVLRTNQKNYPKPEIFQQALSPLTGKGLITNEGAHWHRQRKLMAPSFHRRRIIGMLRIMIEEIEKLSEHWEKLAKENSAIDVLEEMMRLTLNIVSRTLFSTDVMGSAPEISQAVRTAFEYAGYKLNTPFELKEFLTGSRKRKFAVAKALLDETVLEMIRTRKVSREHGNDMLGMLLDAKEEETGEGMSEEQLRDEVLTLMIAGHETTASALSWAWSLLAKNPDKDTLLYRASNKFDPYQNHDDQAFPLPAYAQMVFEETLRLYPPAWGAPRFSLEADQVKGFDILPKKVISLSFWTMFRNPELWPNPEAFEPERFHKDQFVERPRYSFIPFGLGMRQCIGTNMAMVEGPLILAMLAQKFRLSLADPQEEIEIDPTFALRPKGKLMMKLEVRG